MTKSTIFVILRASAFHSSWLKYSTVVVQHNFPQQQYPEQVYRIAGLRQFWSGVHGAHYSLKRVIVS